MAQIRFTTGEVLSLPNYGRTAGNRNSGYGRLVFEASYWMKRIRYAQAKRNDSAVIWNTKKFLLAECRYFSILRVGLLSAAAVLCTVLMYCAADIGLFPVSGLLSGLALDAVLVAAAVFAVSRRVRAEVNLRRLAAISYEIDGVMPSPAKTY